MRGARRVRHKVDIGDIHWWNRRAAKAQDPDTTSHDRNQGGIWEKSSDPRRDAENDPAGDSGVNERSDEQPAWEDVAQLGKVGLCPPGLLDQEDVGALSSSCEHSHLPHVPGRGDRVPRITAKQAGRIPAPQNKRPAQYRCHRRHPWRGAAAPHATWVTKRSLPCGRPSRRPMDLLGARRRLRREVREDILLQELVPIELGLVPPDARLPGLRGREAVTGRRSIKMIPSDRL